jgi:hypothetical protein
MPRELPVTNARFVQNRIVIPLSSQRPGVAAALT